MKKPNILIITSDQQRKDSIGCYNSKLKTPALDLLAKDGVVFDRAYICHPTCTPSRASILTGLLGSKHGAYTIGTALKQDVPMFSKTLAQNGYETYFIGKPHFTQLSTEGSLEYFGIGRDEDYFRNFNEEYFGFKHTKMYNGHTKYSCTAGMHYYLWLKDKGLNDGEIDTLFNYKPADTFREHGVWEIKRELHPTVFTSESAIDYIENRNSEKPFAMWVSFSDPHDPHVTPEPYASMYDPNEVDYLPYVKGEHDKRPSCYNTLYHDGLEALPFDDGIGVPSAPTAKTFGDEKYMREITAIHHGMVKLMDEEIEKIINTLKLQGIYDDTFIIFTTDHGDYLGNHGFVYKGFPAFEEVYNVPFIVKNVKGKNANTKSSALISHLDIAPTLLEVASVDMQKNDEWKNCDGISQLNVCKCKKAKQRQNVIIENRPVQKGFYQKMLVTQQYKIVVYMHNTEGELYDLQKDKNQYNNLWDKQEFIDVKINLLNELYNSYQKIEINFDNNNVKEILKVISYQMSSEKDIAVRTSYS